MAAGVSDRLWAAVAFPEFPISAYRAFVVGCEIVPVGPLRVR